MVINNFIQQNQFQDNPSKQIEYEYPTSQITANQKYIFFSQQSHSPKEENQKSMMIFVVVIQNYYGSHNHSSCLSTIKLNLATVIQNYALFACMDIFILV